MRRRETPKQQTNVKRSVMGAVSDDIQALQAEVKRLRNELKHEKMRADAYETMIDIAETKFDIPISNNPRHNQ